MSKLLFNVYLTGYFSFVFDGSALSNVSEDVFETALNNLLASSNFEELHS